MDLGLPLEPSYVVERYLDAQRRGTVLELSSSVLRRVCFEFSVEELRGLVNGAFYISIVYFGVMVNMALYELV